jgi:hypothetical protein
MRHHCVEQVLAFSRTLVKFWEGLQIELQGQYSPTRLDELYTFTRETGVVRATAILLLTPAICAVTTVALDVLPLRPPTGGIHQQSITYWLRLFFTYSVIMQCTFLQFWHVSPRLPFRRGQVIATTTLLAAAAPICYLSIHLVVGFPTPFALQLTALPLFPIICGALWAMWKTTIRADAEVYEDLQQYLVFTSCTFVMMTLYPVMIYVFGKLTGFQQTLFSFAFPVLKIMFKNWASRGLFRLEDLAPVYVVTSIDVFHALLLSCAMQSADSRGTLVSVMSIDVFQSIIALVEVRAVVKRLEHLHLKVPSPDSVDSLASQTHRQKNVLSNACSSLKSHPHIGNDPAVGLPRHRRQVPWRVFSSMSALVSPTRVVRVGCADSSTDANNSSPLVKGSTTRAAEVDYVRYTLKLLHMVEFYLLIEFIEVVVATIYGMMRQYCSLVCLQ